MRASTRDRPGEVSRSALDHVCAAMVREAFAATRAGAAKGDGADGALDDAVDWMRRVDGEAARAACDRLELAGFRIGERVGERVSAREDPFADEQSAIMCACKEFWTFAHGKRVDALKTNNKGTFVFHDDQFRAMRGVRCSTSGSSAGSSADASSAADALADAALDAVERAYLALHAGIVRGGLKSFGITARVRGELRASPSSASRDARRRPRASGLRLRARAVARRRVRRRRRASVPRRAGVATSLVLRCSSTRLVAANPRIVAPSTPAGRSPAVRRPRECVCNKMCNKGAVNCFCFLCIQ